MITIILGISLAVLLLAKLLNYLTLRNFNMSKFISSFRKIYIMRYYNHESPKIKQYRIVNNILNIMLYVTLLTITIKGLSIIR